MPSLTIRDIPEAVMRAMRQAAKTERRSLNSQAVRWLESEADQWGAGKNLHEVVAQIRERRAAMFRRHGGGTDSVTLVRKTRRRDRA